MSVGELERVGLSFTLILVKIFLKWVWVKGEFGGMMVNWTVVFGNGLEFLKINFMTA